jgi:hypothetical protein
MDDSGSPIEMGRYYFRQALQDSDLETCYRANIAMLLHDRYGMKDHEQYNRAAAEILVMICDDNYLELQTKHDRNKDKKLYLNGLNHCMEVE